MHKSMFALLAVLLMFTGVCTGEDMASVGDAYPLNTCLVRGSALDEDPVVLNHNGREVKFCCNGCKGKFEKDPATYLKKLDSKIVEQQAPYYPMTTCMIMKDEALEEGNTVDRVYNNRLFRFCCKKCAGKFEKNPVKYFEELNQMVVTVQKPKYPLTTCVVSGETLGKGAVDYVHGNRLFRLASKDCVKKFSKNPAKYTDALNKAYKK